MFLTLYFVSGLPDIYRGCNPESVRRDCGNHRDAYFARRDAATVDFVTY